MTYDWQPIETAPKDGTILRLLNDLNEEDVGRWSLGEWTTVYGYGDPTRWKLAGI